MANVIIAIATLMIGFVLVTYGAYNSYHSAKRTEYATRVTHGLNRLSGYVGLTIQDLNRIPAAAELDGQRFSRENGHGLTYTHGPQAGGSPSYYWVCAQAPRSDWMTEAFQKIAASRPDTVVGNSCDSSSTPSAAQVAVTMRIR